VVKGWTTKREVSIPNLRLLGDHPEAQCEDPSSPKRAAEMLMGGVEPRALVTDQPLAIALCQGRSKIVPSRGRYF
jgi:hypothetical protein